MPLSRLSHMLKRIRQEDDRLRFLLSRVLWRTGLCRFLVTELPHGCVVRFHPSPMSAALWENPYFRYEDSAFVYNFLRAGDTYVDLGANVGQLALTAARRVCPPNGYVVAVEPHPRTFRYLQANMRLNSFPDVELHNTAVGDKVGHTVISNLRNDDQNYLGAPKGVRIPITTVDQLLRGRPVTLLKVDVEGYEPFVFEGAKATLRDTTAVYFEASDGNLSRFGYKATDLFDLLGSLGFRLFQFYGEGALEAISDRTPAGKTNNFVAIRDEEIGAALARLQRQ